MAANWWDSYKLADEEEKWWETYRREDEPARDAGGGRGFVNPPMAYERQPERTIAPPPSSAPTPLDYTDAATSMQGTPTSGPLIRGVMDRPGEMPRTPGFDPMLNQDYVASVRRDIIGKAAPEDRMGLLTTLAENRTDVLGRAARQILAEAQAENKRISLDQEGRAQRLLDAPRGPGNSPPPKPGAGVAPPVSIPNVTPGFGDIMDGRSAKQIAERRTLAQGVRAADEGMRMDEANRVVNLDRDRTVGEYFGDLGVRLEQGGIMARQVIANTIDPTSQWAAELAQKMKASQEAISAPEQYRAQQFASKLAQQPNEWAKGAVMLAEFVTNPTIAVEEIVRQGPLMGAMIAATVVGGGVGGLVVRGAAAVAPRVALADAISGGMVSATGRAVGATATARGAAGVAAGGDAAGQVYEELTSKKNQGLMEDNPDVKRLMSEGKTFEEARNEVALTKARLAQSIAATGGVIFGAAGFEGLLAKKIAGQAATGSAKRAATVELTTELADELTTLGASNFAIGQVDPNRKLTQDFGQTAASTVVTTAPLAGASAYMSRKPGDQPAVDTGPEYVARALLDPQNYQSETIRPQQTTRAASDVGPAAPLRTDAGLVAGAVTPAPDVSAQADAALDQIRNATTVDDAISNLSQAAGTGILDTIMPAPAAGPAFTGVPTFTSVNDVLQQPAMPPVTPAPEPLATAPSLTTAPAIDTSLEQATGLDKLRALNPPAPAPMVAPRPQRVLGQPVAQLTDDQLGQIAQDDSISPVARRSASVELDYRRNAAQAPAAAPTVGDTAATNLAPTAVNTQAISQTPTIDFGYPGTPNAPVTQIAATPRNGVLVIPEAPEVQGASAAAPVRDGAAESFNSPADAKRARESAQTVLDRLAAQTNTDIPAQLNRAKPAEDAAINEIAQAMGSQFAGRIYAYNDNRAEALNGIAVNGMAFVNTARLPGDVVPVNVARTTWHEFKHTVEQIAEMETQQGVKDTPAQRFVGQMDSIFDDMTDVGKRAYLENYLAKDTLDAVFNPSTGKGTGTQADREAEVTRLLGSQELRSEMTADFLGNRATDREFLRSLAQADPGGFKGFVQRWIKTIDNMLATLKGDRRQGYTQSARVDKYVQDLQKAKMTARDALVEYSRGTRQGAPATTAAQPQGVQASAATQGSALAIAQSNNTFTGQALSAGKQVGMTQPKGTPVDKLFANFADVKPPKNWVDQTGQKRTREQVEAQNSERLREGMFARANRNPQQFAMDTLASEAIDIGDGLSVQVDAAQKGNTRVQLKSGGEVVAAAALQKGMIDAIAVPQRFAGNEYGVKLLQWVRDNNVANVEEVPDRSPGFVAIQKKVLSQPAVTESAEITGVAPQASRTEQLVYRGWTAREVPVVPASRNLTRLVERLDAGQSTPAEFEAGVRTLAAKMAQVTETKQHNRFVSQRERGPDLVREKLLAARRRGELDEDGVEFAMWALGRNPNLAEGLGVSVRQQPEGKRGASGDYNPVSSVMRLFKDSGEANTAVHEILHHTERMMPVEVQDGVRKEWSKAYAKALRNATPAQRVALEKILPAVAGSEVAHKDVLNAFRSGTLAKDEHYPLVNPSEFWAVNATRLMRGRYDADSWVGKAKQWLGEMLQKAKGFVGMRSDAAVLRALDSVLKGDGKFQVRTMLGDVMTPMAIEQQEAPASESQSMPASASAAAQKQALPVPAGSTPRFSRRQADFTNPEERTEVSTTRPVPAPKKGRTSNSYDEKWVIDGEDVRASTKHVNAIVKALREYNTLSGKGNAPKLMQELHDVVVENLLWLHDLVPANVRERAKLWYDGANRIATDWTSKYGVGLRQSSGVLAVLSPQMDWFKNVSLGERVISIWKNRQNEAWSPAMTAWLQSWVNASKDVDTKASRQAILEEARPLQGMTLAEMTDRQAALYIRAFDETYHERQYRLVTPEGGFGDYVTNADDGDASVTWGGFDTIEKAVSILNDGSFRNIDERLGDEHKVRNFYNNIINPGSADGHVTIDTHAVAAALVKGLSGSSREVADNFGKAGGNAETGASGTYGLFADAYRDAAAQRGILPREMQSITWEAVRALFPASIKDQLAPKVDAVWDRFRKGEITRDQAREEVRALSGGIRKMAWEGSDAGNAAAAGGTSFNTEVDEDPAKRPARTLPPEVAKDKVQVNLSANTGSIPGVAALQAQAATGDMLAHRLLQDIALDNLRHLLSGTSARVKADGVTGLYGGYVESGLSLTVTFADDDRAVVLAALAKFADNFSQEQVHVRKGVKAKAGATFGDGSYATPVYRWELKKALSRKQIENVISQSGLYGLTFGDDFVEAYYVGDPSNEAARAEFRQAIDRAVRLLGSRVERVEQTVERLWAYGDSARGLGFERIQGDVPAGAGLSSETAKRVAGYLNAVKDKDGKPALGRVKTFDNAEVTPKQQALQEEIARAYDRLPDNDLKNPSVRKAYSELTKELLRQYRALPIKVEVFTGNGEPYANSAAMRRDVLDNNHLFIYATEPGQFGPEGQDFSSHPLLGQTGQTDSNGRPMLYNDLLRAVHDYFAHSMSPVSFGPKGEEAAWKNHMAMTPNMWARWALTMETRAQNSWVNFREGLDPTLSLSKRGFAPQKAALLPAQYNLTGDRTVDKPMTEFIGKLGERVRQGSKPVRNTTVRASRRQRTPIGFYSALADGIDNIKTNAAPAAGWKDAIKGLVNKGAVKADEVEWSGVNDWLDLQKGKVTREAVAEYIKQGGVQVEETVLGGGSAKDTFGTTYLEDDESWAVIDQGGNVVESGFETEDEAALNIERFAAKPGEGTKYGQYTLPGGENYREVLLTLPLTQANARGQEESKRLLDEALALDRQAMDAWQRTGNVEEFNRLNERSRDLRRQATAAEKAAGTESYKYQSSHWDQPNVLAHIRVNDRTDADGNKVLFVEELQSDWGQEGKKVGFGVKTFTPQVGPDERENLISLMRKKAQDRMIEVGIEALQAKQVADGLGHDVIAAAAGMEAEYKELLRKENEDRIAEQRARQSVPVAPFVTKTEGWLNLALKRVMVMAAEGGYDKVAFVNGEQSAERYDLSKQVNYVQWNAGYNNGPLISLVTKENDETIGISAEKDGTIYDSSLQGAEGKKLDEVLGKELAEKILASPSGSLSGLQLKMGGEGMKTFYDTIVPTALKKLLPKVGGGQMEQLALVNQRADFDYDQLENATPEEIEQLDAGGVSLLQPGFDVTDAMREKVQTTGLPMFSRRQKVDSLFVDRDEAGYPRFGAGAKAYGVVANIANQVLDVVSMKPISPELSRAMRGMKIEVEKAQKLTADVAKALKELPEDERQMISDVIEGELKAGVIPPQRVLALAASMQTIMSQQSAELVRLGMLTQEAADRWDGKYLPRFYEQKLGDEVKAWAKAARALLAKTGTMQGVKGDSLKARGMFETIPAGDLQQWEAQGWEVRDPGYQQGDPTIQVWRDFTRDERDDMGEIRDAMFRFVMGYTKSQRDVALGRLYEQLAGTVASRTQQPGYVQVPRTLVEDTVAKRYGALAGKWVPSEVLDHLSAFDTSMQNDLVKMYLKGLSMWKEGKTVLNPVAHANNVLSNLTMAHFAGVSYWDVNKYAGAVRDLVKNDPMVAEAQDAGLFLGTFNRTELLNDMPEQLKQLAGMSESRLAKGVDTAWSALSWFLRKPMGKAYEAEDQFFRYLIYRDARKRGMSADDAVDYSQQFIFTYDDLPKGARLVRDTALPFFSYTYKSAPVLLRTAMEYPWRFAAPAAALGAVNAMMYAMAAAVGDDDDWLEVLKRYATDKEFRERAQALEAWERKNLPVWMKGGTAFSLEFGGKVYGMEKAIRLGLDEVTQLPLFLDVSRTFPGGTMFDATNNAGGVPLIEPLTPNSPLLSIYTAMFANRDLFRGNDLVNKNTDTSMDAAEKRAAWLWKQLTPAIAVGNIHFDRAMDTIANATGKPLMGYTGIGNDGTPVQMKYSILQTMGIKVRPIDLEVSQQMGESDKRRIIRDLESQISRLNKREQLNKATPDNADIEREKLREKLQRVREGLTVDGEERE